MFKHTSFSNINYLPSLFLIEHKLWSLFKEYKICLKLLPTTKMFKTIEQNIKLNNFQIKTLKTSLLT